MKAALPLAALLATIAGSGGAQPTADALLPPPLARSLRGLVPLERSNCIRIIDAVEPSGAGDTILWRAGRKIYYRNDTEGTCRGLARGDRITTVRFGSDQLCRGDIVRTSDRTSGVLTGSCTLGDFVRYAPPTAR